MSDTNSLPADDILEAVYEIIQQRKQSGDGEKSYVKSLFEKGLGDG